ncbi:MAG: hypothetical protein Q7S03_03165 [bacterium]|nr:hypothetical protein [bacterium]
MYTLEELLKKKEEALVKLSDVRQKLNHPHGDGQSAHDLAETEFNVYSSYLEDIEKQIFELRKKK